MAAQQRARSGSSAAFGQARQTNNSSAGFGLPRRSNTPEPWVRRLADDGMSYYYINKLDGTVQWTVPDVSNTSRTNGHSRSIPSSSNHSALERVRKQDTGSAVSDRLRSDSEVSNMRRGRSDSAAGGASVYSDDSDVDPIDRRPPVSSANGNGTRSHETRQVLTQSRPPQPQDFGELTSAEKYAQDLQQALAPPAPDSMTELAGIARQAVAAVVDFIQAHDVLGRLPQQQELDNHILDAVVAIRNLLCISSPPYGHISSSLYPKEGLDPKANALLQTLQAQLKPAQRKVTATLSKLVLAVLAAQYDPSTSSIDTPTRMEADAAELDRALVTFVLEVQRSNSQAAMQPTHIKPNQKRLRAAFAPNNIGLGLIGAGAAGDWKGFGWVAPNGAGESPQRVLGNDVLIELRASVSDLDGRLVALGSFLATPDAGKIRAYLHSVRTSSSFVANQFLKCTPTGRWPSHGFMGSLSPSQMSPSLKPLISTVSNERAQTRTCICRQSTRRRFSSVP